MTNIQTNKQEDLLAEISFLLLDKAKLLENDKIPFSKNEFEAFTIENEKTERQLNQLKQKIDNHQDVSLEELLYLKTRIKNDIKILNNNLKNK